MNFLPLWFSRNIPSIAFPLTVEHNQIVYRRASGDIPDLAANGLR
ncbi:MAG: hypothetical protein WBC78_20065 [Candidatus Sulfotelmatobacter sp.]